MSGAPALAERLAELGITVWTDGGVLCIHPSEAVSPDLADELRHHRDELVRFLESLNIHSPRSLHSPCSPPSPPSLRPKSERSEWGVNGDRSPLKYKENKGLDLILGKSERSERYLHQPPQNGSRPRNGERGTVNVHRPDVHPVHEPTPSAGDLAALAVHLGELRTEAELQTRTGWPLVKLWSVLSVLIDSHVVLRIHDLRPGRESRRFRLNVGAFYAWRDRGFPLSTVPALDVDE